MSITLFNVVFLILQCHVQKFRITGLVKTFQVIQPQYSQQDFSWVIMTSVLSDDLTLSCLFVNNRIEFD